MTHPTPTVPAPVTRHPRTERAQPTPGWATAAHALAAFTAARLIGLLALAATAHATHQDTFRLLGRSWDSRWYTGIAAHGYGRTLYFEPGVVQSDLAFFPLYPGLIRAVTAVTPLTHGAAGLLVSWVAAAAAAVGIFAIAARLHDRRTATVLVLLWGLLPHSVILSMAYTEPVLTALAAGSLYALLTGRWIWAGALAALAGLARPNGLAVAAAVLATALYQVLRQNGRVSHRLWTGAALAPLGWAGYVLWVGVREGDPLGGYFAVQRRWGSRFDFGAGSLAFVKHLLLDGDKLVFSMTLVIVAAAVLLFALLVAAKAPLPLLVYSGMLLLITVGGSGFFESKPRFLLPAFPLLLPLACALVRTAKARPGSAVLVVGALAGLSVAYGAYLVTIARMPL
ncbi:mannosyltransferase family protein [Streptomyces sp. NPDC059063]|uniref:mannosyltransferase family protein n=1 Tax=unclassified Streptomyces TaxID=2593676 RepID=UPI0036889589